MGKKLILVVEDEKDTAEEIIKNINKITDDEEVSKYTTIWAKNGLEALKNVCDEHKRPTKTRAKSKGKGK